MEGDSSPIMEKNSDVTTTSSSVMNRMKVSSEEDHYHQKMLSEHSRITSSSHEDLNMKYNNNNPAAPRLTHPPYTFPTYQGTYCLSSYQGGMEPRIVNGVSYPVPVDAPPNKSDSYGRNTLLSNSDLEWRA